MGEYQASPLSQDVHNSHSAKLAEQCQPKKKARYSKGREPGAKVSRCTSATFITAVHQQKPLKPIIQFPSVLCLEPVHRKFSVVTWPTPLAEAAAAIWPPVAAGVAAASLQATAGAICCHPLPLSEPSPKAWQGDSGAGGCATEGTGRELEKPWQRKLASC